MCHNTTKVAGRGEATEAAGREEERAVVKVVVMAVVTAAEMEVVEKAGARAEEREVGTEEVRAAD